jgi:hypothetical protein
LDFVANFLLAKLGSGLKALGGKLKGIAQRLGKKKAAKGKKAARSKRGARGGRARRGPPSRRKPSRKRPPTRKVTRSQRDKRAKDRQGNQRVMRAVASVNAQFAREVPEQNADDIVRNVARRFRVRHTLSDSADSLGITFSGSATGRARARKKKGDASRAARASQSRQAAQSNASSGAAAAKQGAQNVAKGRKFERAMARKISAEIEGRGGRASEQARGSAGLDVVGVFPNGLIEVYEVKAGKPVAFKTRAKGKGTPKERVQPRAGDERFSERSGRLRRGVSAAAVVREEAAARRSSLIGQVVGGREFVTSTGRSVENKVSAFTTNLKTNLNKLHQDLLAQAEAAKDRQDQKELRALARKVKALMAGKVGRLEVIVVSPRAPSENELEAMEALLKGATQELKGVQVEPIKTRIEKRKVVVRSG